MAGLLIVTGPPGAGKSTVAGLLAGRAERSALVSGDRFFEFLAGGRIDPWLAGAEEQNLMVAKAAAAAAGQFARGGAETVYDGIVHPWFLPTFAAAAGLARVDYVVLLPPVQTCVERVLSRTGHGFTDEAATRMMHDDFAKSDVARRHILHGPTAAASDIAAAIARGRSAGQLTFAVP